MPDVEKSEQQNEVQPSKRRSRKARAETIETAQTFDIAPAPEEPKETVIDKLFSRLNLKEEAGQEPKTYPGLKLDKKKQEFVNGMTPIASSLFVLLCGWMWRFQGNQYSVLVPTNEIADSIVAPLIRVWARIAGSGSAINPNYIDLAASITALIAYVDTSLSLRQAIKNGEWEIIGGYDGGEPVSEQTGNHRHAHREAAYASAESQNGTVRSTASVAPETPKHLTGRERRAYEALARLSELDYQHRARQSGHF